MTHVRTPALLVLAGCLSPNPPPEQRFFAPAWPADLHQSGLPGERPLRLARVSAAGHLRERMVVRRSDVEYGFDDEHLWLREPVEFTEEALIAALFVSGGFRSSTARDAPAVEVRLGALELVAATPPTARVELTASLEHPDGALQKSFAIERPLTDLDRAAFAREAGVALGEAVRRVERWLDESLP
jgi:uncharacterized lipoprotein YmbA